MSVKSEKSLHQKVTGPGSMRPLSPLSSDFLETSRLSISTAPPSMTLRVTNDLPHPELAFNLDGHQMKRLEKVLRIVHFKAKESAPIVPVIINNRQKETGKLKIKKWTEIKRTEYVQKRLLKSKLSNGNFLCCIGDEHRLRLELDNDKTRGINERDYSNGRTMLVEAASAGHHHVCRALITEYDANVNTTSLLGKSTPLHCAVEGSFRQIASLLITHGAELNAQDSRGCTPLYLVKKMSLVRLLFKFPVDVRLKTKDGLSPSEYYFQCTDADSRDPDVYAALMNAEDALFLEDAREKQRAIAEFDGLSMSTTSGDSLIGFSITNPAPNKGYRRIKNIL